MRPPRRRYPSDSTRTLRRRAAAPEKAQAYDFIDLIRELLGYAPDELAAKGLRKLIHNVRLRFSSSDKGDGGHGSRDATITAAVGKRMLAALNSEASQAAADGDERAGDECRHQRHHAAFCLKRAAAA